MYCSANMLSSIVLSTLVIGTMGQFRPNRPTSPIRISAYDDPLEFGRKIDSDTNDNRPKRNVTNPLEIPGSVGFEATTRRGFFPQGSLGAGNAPGVPILPPATPFPFPPSPPPSGTGGVTLPFPPAVPLLPLTPSPPVLPGPIRPEPSVTQITEIECMKTSSKESFSAVLSLPEGFEAVPVFEDTPTIDPTTNPSCRMIPTQLVGMFQLFLSDLNACGIKECRQDNGENWLCLLLRFPVLTGLKLPEDEIVEIRCRPQDRTADDIDVITVATAKYADKSAINNARLPSVFEGGKQEFQCEIGLFAKLKGTDMFTKRVMEDDELELGEEVQLRSIVRPGDGWEFSMLKEIVIQKMGGDRERSTLNTAVLVFSDGCRNPEYKVVAKNHPQRDQRNTLINNFIFRIFMFQDMLPGDSLMVSAKVVGCVDEEDCRPTLCPDDQQRGYGKRKRRATGEYTVTQVLSASDLPLYPPPHGRIPRSTSYPSSESHVARKESKSTDWERNLGIKIKVPEAVVRHESLEVMEANECRLYLFITLGMASLFCFASIVFVVATYLRSRSNKNPPRPSSPQCSPQMIATSMPSMTSSDTLSSNSNSETSLPNFSVPPTVRQRKRDVHQELLNVFDDKGNYPFGAYYPGMMNYYGYMVVPRKPDAKEGKKSLRAMKREQRRHHEVQHDCSCKPEDKSSDEESNTSSIKNHTSVIHINSTDSKPVFSQRPLPKPRSTVGYDDSIYSEIVQDTLPTMV
ncbi:unnamed protein product [Meganyctiphanes norvegica]|uniref:ZP domain-containing protein n=1 Tax=Meganyctiphanes norvegica TaxID=48144 RepID=A0AAV2RST1_MEGNR